MYFVSGDPGLGPSNCMVPPEHCWKGPLSTKWGVALEHFHHAPPLYNSRLRYFVFLFSFFFSYFSICIKPIAELNPYLLTAGRAEGKRKLGNKSGKWKWREARAYKRRAERNYSHFTTSIMRLLLYLWGCGGGDHTWWYLGRSPGMWSSRDQT